MERVRVHVVTGFSSTLIPCIVRRAPHNRHDCSVCSHLLGSHVVFLNRRVGSIDTGLIITRLLRLRDRSTRGSVSLCVGSPNNRICSNLTVLSAVGFVGPRISAVYINVTTSVTTILLSTNTGNGHFYLPRSGIVVRRPDNNTRNRRARVRVITRRVGGAHHRLGRVLSSTSNRPVRGIRTSARHSGCLATTRTLSCNLVSHVIASHSLTTGST